MAVAWIREGRSQRDFFQESISFRHLNSWVPIFPHLKSKQCRAEPHMHIECQIMASDDLILQSHLCMSAGEEQYLLSRRSKTGDSQLWNKSVGVAPSYPNALVGTLVGLLTVVYGQEDCGPEWKEVFICLVGRGKIGAEVFWFLVRMLSIKPSPEYPTSLPASWCELSWWTPESREPYH